MRSFFFNASNSLRNGEHHLRCAIGLLRPTGQVHFFQRNPLTHPMHLLPVLAHRQRNYSVGYVNGARCLITDLILCSKDFPDSSFFARFAALRASFSPRIIVPSLAICFTKVSASARVGAFRYWRQRDFILFSCSFQRFEDSFHEVLLRYFDTIL